MNDDNDDLADEPEGAKEIDNTNNRIDGAEDRKDMKKLTLSAPPASVVEGEMRLHKTGVGKVRIFDATDGSVILNPDDEQSINLWDSNGKAMLVEGVEAGKVVKEKVLLIVYSLTNIFWIVFTNPLGMKLYL